MGKSVGRPKGAIKKQRRIRTWNRMVCTIPAPQRFLIDKIRTKHEYDTDSGVIRDLVEAGLKKKFPEEWAALEQDWKEHQKDCIDKGQSSDFFLVDTLS